MDAVASVSVVVNNAWCVVQVAKRRLRAARPAAPPAPGDGAALRSLLATESRHLALPEVTLSYFYILYY